MGVSNENNSIQVANDSQSEAKMLAVLAYDTNEVVREAVARNPSTPALVFESLMRDVPNVRIALASNPKIVEPYISSLIYQTEDPKIFFALANNPSIDSDHIRLISNKVGYSDGLLVKNAKCPEDILRISFAAFEETLNTVEKPNAIHVESILNSFINNPNTPLDVLGKIAVIDEIFEEKILHNIRINHPFFENTPREDLFASLKRQVKPIY